MLYRQLVAMASAVVCFAGYTLVVQAQPDLVQFREHTELAQNHYSDRPEVNPAPQRILVIQVHKDPRIELWLDSLYGTTNAKCMTQTAFARFAGAPDVPQDVYDSVRLPAGQSDFSVRFFLDHYLPGECKWQPMGIGHSEFLPEDSLHPQVHSGVVGVAHKEIIPWGPVGLSETELVWDCHRKENSDTRVKGLFCMARPDSVEKQTMSIDGGLVKIEFTLAPD
ncbi:MULTISPECIES: hypothetical protein [unclassified Burkholderia]|uniref:hypothetical protein n=1 Tax=unclassified Burkholderia TaxID=2613784 RepID=UPI002AAF4CAD|nr:MULTISPECIES: hypothetical protein [unclassified Burkholderia]